MPLDSGLLALVSLLRFLGKPADPAQLRHQFAPDGESVAADHMRRAARRLDVEERRERTPPERLEKAALPAIALLKNGRRQQKRDAAGAAYPTVAKYLNMMPFQWSPVLCVTQPRVARLGQKAAKIARTHDA